MLDFLIPEFLENYKKLYGDLVFKFHSMLHYTRVLRALGPLTNFWGMRYESRHRDLKLSAVATNCTKNLTDRLFSDHNYVWLL